MVVDYDPAWPTLFDFLRRRIGMALGSVAAAVEHVGSTAVPGLAAKPIIDMDVLLVSGDGLAAAIERLASLGYVHQGDLGIAERQAFIARAVEPRHHLYVCPPGSREYQRHLALRHYLRSHPDDAREYGTLKKTLAAKFANERTAYMAGKDAFVRELLNRALLFQ